MDKDREATERDYIIKLQKQRIESLENAIGLAKDDYYDKGSEYDCSLWNHPVMTALMAVLSNDGYTPMSKGTQICLVKAAIAAMPATTVLSVEKAIAMEKIQAAAIARAILAAQKGV